MAHDEQDYTDGWQTYSSWIDNLRDTSEIISKYDNNSGFKQKLLACKTNYEQFEFIWHNNELKSEIEKYYRKDLVQCEKRCQNRITKSDAESTKMRQLGNTSFKNSKYLEALNQYTQAIKFAPYPSQESEDKSLAFALANRSAVLYALTRYRLCLLDIDLAIKYGYPEENMFKLLIRKVKCLHILSVWANDVEQIKDNLKSMLKNRDTSKLVKTEIQNMFDFLQHTQPEQMDKDELDVIDETVMKISNVSKTVSQSADCVEMSYEADKGRYLMTNKDVTFGRLLVAEEPYVCNLAPEKQSNYCYNCFGCLYSCGLGCRTCSQVLYCSEDCLNSRDQVHSFECNGFLDFQDKLGVAYLVAHLMFKVKFDLTSFPICTKKVSDQKSLEDILRIPPCDWPDLVFKNSYASVLSLMDHSSDYEYDEIMGFAITSVYLMIAFIDRFSETTTKLKDEKNQLLVGSIILRHLLQLQTNLISILDQNLQTLVSVGHTLTEVKERPIGVGIYPTVSLLNHSCSPNILSIFHRNKFVARAAKMLDCGTELNYCYGPSVNRMSKKDRQKRLREQYFFDCKCDSCSQNKENESRALVCPQCQGPVIFNLDYTHQCMSCKAEDVLDVRDYLQQINDMKSAIELMSGEKCEEIEHLKEFEIVLGKLVHWRHPLFVQIKSKLIELATAIEDFDLTEKLCEEELNLCAKTYGEDSYESIMTKMKLINTKWQRLYFEIESATEEDSKQHGIDELKSLQSTVNTVKGKLKELLASTNILGAESSYEGELRFLGDIHTSIANYLESLRAPESDQTNQVKTESD